MNPDSQPAPKTTCDIQDKLDVLLSDAMDCLKGETPEDMTKKESRELTIERIQRYLRYGELE